MGPWVGQVVCSSVTTGWTTKRNHLHSLQIVLLNKVETLGPELKGTRGLSRTSSLTAPANSLLSQHEATVDSAAR